MTRFLGLDVHKHFIEVCILDASRKVVFRGKTDCRREELERFAKAKLKRTDRVALESTTNTWPVVEILRPYVTQIVVGNPLKTKAIAEAKVKTDKVDAEVLAHLLRCDYIYLRCGNPMNALASCAVGSPIVRHSWSNGHASRTMCKVSSADC